MTTFIVELSHLRVTLIRLSIASGFGKTKTVFLCSKHMNYVDLASEHIAELYPIIVYGKPAIMDLEPGTILGTWAHSTPGKIRYILDRSLELAAGVLPADVSRAWVRDTYKLPFRRRKDQLERSFSVPIKAIIGKHGACAYVDIKGAYLKILSLGYDVEYRAGHYIGASTIEIPEVIQSNKFCYSIAVAMSGSARSNLQIMGKEGLFEHKPFNNYSNPCLFNLAQDTLNAIGAEVNAVLGAGCVYINTDGFIVKEPYQQICEEIIESWGFASRVKHRGETEVRGVASYQVGDYKTKRFDQNALNFTSLLMDREQRKWLKTRWRTWSQVLRLDEIR